MGRGELTGVTNRIYISVLVEALVMRALFL